MRIGIMVNPADKDLLKRRCEEQAGLSRAAVVSCSDVEGRTWLQGLRENLEVRREMEIVFVLPGG